MSFNQEIGYVPTSFNTMMGQIRQAINERFNLDYTEENFVGSNFYKYFYALVQKAVENETKTSEIFLKLQEYIAQTNSRIQRPSVSHPGVIDTFASNGYVANVKKNTVGDAGTISICVDVDDGAEDYAETKLAICNIIRDVVTAGIVSLGDESESITLSNGQSFDFKFSLATHIPVILRLTLTKSLNSQLAIPSDQVIRQKLFDHINARYRLGWDFEPERYFEVTDEQWASDVYLEWSDDEGENWKDTIYYAEFDEIFTFGLNDIAVVVQDPE